MSRRRYYRVNTRNLPLHVTALTKGGESIYCRLEDINLQGAKIRLPTTGVEVLPIGTELDLKIVRPGEFKVILRTVVVRSEEEDSLRSYGVRFLDPSETLENLSPAAAGLFNRRANQRIKPTHPVFVSVQTATSSVMGSMLDLSMGGILLSVTRRESMALEDQAAVEVKFALHGDPERYVFTGTLRDRGEEDDGHHWAVVFGSSSANTTHQPRLSEHIARQLRERIG